MFGEIKVISAAEYDSLRLALAREQRARQDAQSLVMSCYEATKRNIQKDQEETRWLAAREAIGLLLDRTSQRLCAGQTCKRVRLNTPAWDGLIMKIASAAKMALDTDHGGSE